jgi:hypothetical protein
LTPPPPARVLQIREELDHMASIDDPIEATRKQYPEESKNQIFELSLAAASALSPAFGLVESILSHFSTKAAFERVEALLKTLEEEVRRHDRDLLSLKDRLRSPEFIQTLMVAVDYTARTADLRKVQRFAAVLADGLVLGDQSERLWEDAAAFIRDAAELGEADIQVLGVLYSIQGNLPSSHLAPVQQDAAGKMFQLSPDPNPFTELHEQVLNKVDEQHIPRDEFYSRCARLSGFGLVLEVPTNVARQSPGDYCYRITVRGKRLAEILERKKA